MPSGDELWRPVLGHEGHYEVSDRGSVRSLDREAEYERNGQVVRRMFRGRPLRQQTYNGYKFVGLGRGTLRTVHSLVAEVFLGPRPPGLVCRHRNGRRDDNRAENLLWGTHSENVRDSVEHGTQRNTRKTHCPRGHVLAGDNLREDHARVGKRGCKACCMAQGAARRSPHLHPDVPALADRYYARLLGVA